MCVEPQEKLAIESSPEYADDLFFLRKDDNHRIKKEMMVSKYLMVERQKEKLLREIFKHSLF